MRMNMDTTCLTDGKTGHTPGPWRTCELSYEEGGRGQVVADVPTCFGTIAVRADVLTACPSKAELDRQGAANARLIAASPDLLAACRMALPMLEAHAQTGCDCHDSAAYRAMKAAIARAEGRA